MSPAIILQYAPDPHTNTKNTWAYVWNNLSAAMLEGLQCSFEMKCEKVYLLLKIRPILLTSYSLFQLTVSLACFQPIIKVVGP